MYDSQSARRIHMFIPDLQLGGAERVFVTLANQFSRRGYLVKIILADKVGPLLHELDTGVDVVNLKARKDGEGWLRFGLRTLLSLTHYIRDNSPEVLLSTLTGANITLISARILSRRNFRLVIREAATLANVHSTLRLWAMRLLYCRADHIIALTSVMKSKLSNRLDIVEEKITVIANPIDSKRINRLANEECLELDRFTNRSYVLSIGRLAEPKDLRTPIHAIKLVNSQHTMDLVIIGDGPLRPELQALATNLKIDDRVHFLGFRSNPYCWLKQASLFVLSSRWEGYPNVLLEAIALSKPVVITEYDASVKEVLSDYPDSMKTVVPVGAAEEMANALTVMIKHTDPTGDITQTSMSGVIDQYLNVLSLKESPSEA